MTISCDGFPLIMYVFHDLFDDSQRVYLLKSVIDFDEAHTLCYYMATSTLVSTWVSNFASFLLP